VSEFIQRSDRSIELPLGCKDLLDLEEIRSWKPGTGHSQPNISTDQLAYLEGYLAGLLESSGGSVLVGISLFQGMGHVYLIPDAALQAPVIFASWNGASQEHALRRALEEAGLQPATEPVGRWKASRTWKYLLPPSPAAAARAIGQIFRTGYGLGDLASVTLWYHEPRTA
jgi:hypothetical protein